MAQGNYCTRTGVCEREMNCGVLQKHITHNKKALFITVEQHFASKILDDPQHLEKTKTAARVRAWEEKTGNCRVKEEREGELWYLGAQDGQVQENWRLRGERAHIRQKLRAREGAQKRAQESGREA